MAPLPLIHDPLSHDAIFTALIDVNQRILDQLIVLDCVDSTNSYLLRQAKAGSTDVIACFAEEQTTGRGRSARTWYSPRGLNLYASLLWHFASPQPALATLSLAVGVMMVRVLTQLGATDCCLKWPNDVYCRGRKLAGILIESVRMGDHPTVVIGVGINLSGMVQSEWAMQAIDLEEVLDRKVPRDVIAGSLLNALLTSLPHYAKVGFDDFYADWQRYDVLAGKQIVIRTPQQMQTGVAQGVNVHGELLLRTHAGQMHRYHCGEVSVRSDEGSGLTFE